jgi:hypothetical protein
MLVYISMSLAFSGMSVHLECKFVILLFGLSLMCFPSGLAHIQQVCIGCSLLSSGMAKLNYG